MHQDKSLLDLEFGLTQLSGNRELLVKLLGKFQAEYTDADNKFSTLINSGDHTEAKNMIHTIKGVSGNLGMNALHLLCKQLEQSILADSVGQTLQDDFTAILERTFLTIEALSSDNGNEEPLEPSTGNAKAKLIAALQKNEYIPADKLDAMLAGTELNDMTKENVSNAINDLDYATALSLLEG